MRAAHTREISMGSFVLSAIAAAALLAAGTTQAASSTSASATLSNLQIQLFDLNPGDGISPSISFSFGPQSNQGSASARWSTSTAAQNASGSFFSDANPWRPGQTEAPTSFASANAAIAGNGTPGGTTLSASGQGSGPDSFYDPDFFNFTLGTAQFSASAQAPSFFFGSFELSPFTLVVFSATVAVQASAIEGGIITFPDGFSTGFGNNASASASLNVSGPAAGGGNGFQQASDGRSVFVNSFYDSWFGTWFNSTAAESGFVGVSFTNLTGTPMLGSFRAETSVNGWAYGNTTPIPEPGTWALLLAGLAVVGRVAARRR
jgi:hypothetical protein